MEDSNIYLEALILGVAHISLRIEYVEIPPHLGVVCLPGLNQMRVSGTVF